MSNLNGDIYKQVYDRLVNSEVAMVYSFDEITSTPKRECLEDYIARIKEEIERENRNLSC